MKTLKAVLLAQYAELEGSVGLSITDGLGVDVAEGFLDSIEKSVLNLFREWLEEKRQEEIKFYKVEKHWNPSYAIFNVLLETFGGT